MCIGSPTRRALRQLTGRRGRAREERTCVTMPRQHDARRSHGSPSRGVPAAGCGHGRARTCHAPPGGSLTRRVWRTHQSHCVCESHCVRPARGVRPRVAGLHASTCIHMLPSSHPRLLALQTSFFMRFESSEMYPMHVTCHMIGCSVVYYGGARSSDVMVCSVVIVHVCATRARTDGRI